MGKSHGKGTSFFLALPPREWGQNLVRHACLLYYQQANVLCHATIGYCILCTIAHLFKVFYNASRKCFISSYDSKRAVKETKWRLARLQSMLPMAYLTNDHSA